MVDLVILMLLVSSVNGLKSWNYDVIVSKKYEPPYLSEFTAAEKSTCVQMCSKNSKCVGVVYKTCSKDGEWCALADDFSAITEGDSTYSILVPSDSWSQNSGSSSGGNYTPAVLDDIPRAFSVGPYRPVYCPNGNPVFHTGHYRNAGYHPNNVLSNTDGLDWLTADNVVNNGIIFNYKCTFTIRNIVLYQTQRVGQGTKDFEVKVSHDAITWVTFVKGTMAAYCTGCNYKYFFSASPLSGQYIYFMVKSFHKNYSGLEYMKINDDSMC